MTNGTRFISTIDPNQTMTVRDGLVWSDRMSDVSWTLEQAAVFVHSGAWRRFR